MGAPRPPAERDCPPDLWELEGRPCIKRLLDDGTVERRCPGDLDYPEDLVGYTLLGYNCERDYQDFLISRCRKWRR